MSITDCQFRNEAPKPFWWKTTTLSFGFRLWLKLAAVIAVITTVALLIVNPDRPLHWRPDMAAVLAVGGLVVGLFLANVVTAGIRHQLQIRGGPTVWYWGETIRTLAVNALLVGVLYKVLPKVSVQWRNALAGGVLVSLIWYVGQRLLVAFVIGESYSAYGVVGSFIAVMLWLYYASATIFLGAEFVRALGEGKE